MKVFACLFVVLAACGGHAHPSTPPTPVTAAGPVTATAPAPAVPQPPVARAMPAVGPIAPDLEQRMARFQEISVGVDDTTLDAKVRPVIAKLVEAAKLIQTAFLRQVDPQNLALRAALAADPKYKHALAFFDFMGGPWDRTDPHEQPFIGTRAKPPGGGFYPPDVTKADIEQWIAAHPADKAAFESYFTTITRDPSGGLRAVPYSEAYADQLRPAAERLHEAAALTDDPRIKKFLEARADAFASNDYLASDIAWMDLGDAPLEITIGPYEVYDDELMGWKASFEAFIGFRDAAESARLAKVNAKLHELDLNLPLDAKYRAHTTRGSASPISVVELVYSSGQPGIHPVAYNLPNDERVRKVKGTKKVMLKNVSEAKFKAVSAPIAARAMTPAQQPLFTFDAFFTFVLMHEMCHGFGPATVVTKTGTEDVSKALQELYSPVEEAKADVCGIISTQWLVDHGVFPRAFGKQIYAIALGSAFRAVRFGATEAHARGELASFNFVVEHGGFRLDPKTKRFEVDFGKVQAAERALAHEWLMIEATGDRDRAKAFLDRYAVMKPEMAAIVASLQDIPVDIRMHFTIEDQLAAK